MSAPLIDIRSAIDEATNAVLEAHSLVHGITKAEIVRNILKEWRSKELTVHREVRKQLNAQGLDESGSPKGVRG